MGKNVVYPAALQWTPLDRDSYSIQLLLFTPINCLLIKIIFIIIPNPQEAIRLLQYIIDNILTNDQDRSEFGIKTALDLYNIITASWQTTPVLKSIDELART